MVKLRGSFYRGHGYDIDVPREIDIKPRICESAYNENQLYAESSCAVALHRIHICWEPDEVHSAAENDYIKIWLTMDMHIAKFCSLNRSSEN
jgi:hypothetical protein